MPLANALQILQSSAPAGAPAAPSSGLANALQILQSTPSGPIGASPAVPQNAQQLTQGDTLRIGLPGVGSVNTGVPMPGWLDRGLIGAGHGAMSILGGVKQLGMDAGAKMGLVSQGADQAYQQHLQDQQNLWNATQPTTAMNVGDFLGQTATTLPAALATDFAAEPLLSRGAGLLPDALSRAAPLLSDVGRGAAQGIGVGATLPVLPGQSRGDNIALGGLLGAAAPAALGAARTGLGAVRDAFFPNTRRAAASVLQGLRIDPGAVPSAPQTPGVQFTLGQATNDPGFLALENTLRMKNNIPFDDLGRQNNSAMNAALDQLAPKRVDVADASVGDALKGALASAKGQAKTLYGRVGDLAQGVPPAVPTNLRNAAQGLLGQYSDLFDRPGLTDPALKSKLAGILGGIDDGGTQVLPGSPGAPASVSTAHDPFALGSPVPVQTNPGFPARPAMRVPNRPFDPLGSLGNAQLPEGAPASWGDLQWLRQRLNNFYGRAAKSAGAAGSQELGGLSSLLHATNADQEALAQASGNPSLMDALQQANQHYQTHVAPFKAGPLKAATSNELTNAGATLVRPGAPNQGALVDTTLSAAPDAQSALAQAYMARLADAARTQSVDLSGNKILSPAGLSGFLNTSQPLMERLGTPEAQASAQGLLGDLQTIAKGTALRVKGGSDTAGQTAGIADLASKVSRRLLVQHALAKFPLLSEVFEPMLKASEDRVGQQLLQAVLNPGYGSSLLDTAMPRIGVRGAPWLTTPWLLYLHHSE